MRLIWDWNGTLLDDNHASVNALNTILARRHLNRISLGYYRQNFAFPVRGFYEKVGVRLECEDWDSLAQEYHDAYHASELQLAYDAKVALELAKSLGFSQSVVSALREDYLLSDMDKFGICGYFDAIFGTGNLDGCSKLSRMHDCAARFPNDRYIVIGDSIHDYEAATSIGAKCVLFSGGSHASARLEPYAPVAATLVEAVQCAYDIITKVK